MYVLACLLHQTSGLALELSVYYPEIPLPAPGTPTISGIPAVATGLTGAVRRDPEAAGRDV